MPSADSAIRIAQTLGVTVEQLFGGRAQGRGERPELGQSRDEKLVATAQKLAKQMQEFAKLLANSTGNAAA
jgi:hypothetical protein